MSRATRSRHPASRRFGFETLESRQLMVSDVSAVLSNGVLTITGTNDIDRFTINSANIFGANGITTINGLSSFNFNIAQVQNIVINLKDGADRIFLFNTNISGNLSIDMGNGDDSVTTQTTSAKNITINLGEGKDGLNDPAVSGAEISLTTGEACVINAGPGDDLINLENYNCVTDLIVNGEDGNDVISAKFSSAGRSLSVTSGNDRDQIIIENFTAVDQMAVNGGNPPIIFTTTIFGVPLQIPGPADNATNSIVVKFSSSGKNATILGGALADLIRVEGDNFLGTAYINGKEGDDNITMSGCISNTFDYLFGGEGNDTIKIDACNVTSGKFEIKGAGGNDTVTMNGCIADTIFADMGDDTDVLTLTNNTFRLAAGNELRGGKNRTFLRDRLIRTNNSATLDSALVVEFEQFN